MKRRDILHRGQAAMRNRGAPQATAEGCSVWTQSSTIALARQKCFDCMGLGMTVSFGSSRRPCKCVLRQIFRVCLRKFKACGACPPSLSGGMAILTSNNLATCGSTTRRRFGYPKSEYMADFLLIAKRTLGADSIGYRVFTQHFEHGHQWRACCRRLGMDRGSFFHEVYRVEEKLGRAFREVQPFALFPVDEYFRGTTGEKTGHAGTNIAGR